MTTVLAFRVNGLPGAQGSKKHVGNGIMVESSKRVKPWRSDVKARAEKMAEYQEWEQATGPVEVSVCFYFKRPAAHYRTGRNASELRPNAPIYPSNIRSGDVDKLQRSTFDALTAAGVIRDDSLIVTVRAEKRWTLDGISGAEIVVIKLPS